MVCAWPAGRYRRKRVPADGASSGDGGSTERGIQQGQQDRDISDRQPAPPNEPFPFHGKPAKPALFGEEAIIHGQPLVRRDQRGRILTVRQPCPSSRVLPFRWQPVRHMRPADHPRPPCGPVSGPSSTDSRSSGAISGAASSPTANPPRQSGHAPFREKPAPRSPRAFRRYRSSNRKKRPQPLSGHAKAPSEPDGACWQSAFPLERVTGIGPA